VFLTLLEGKALDESDLIKQFSELSCGRYRLIKQFSELSCGTKFWQQVK
jgi:hypothetical protein